MVERDAKLGGGKNGGLKRDAKLGGGKNGGLKRDAPVISPIAGLEYV